MCFERDCVHVLPKLSTEKLMANDEDEYYTKDKSNYYLNEM